MDNWAAQVAVQFFFCGWGSSVIVNYRRWVAKGPSGRGQGMRLGLCSGVKGL